MPSPPQLEDLQLAAFQAVLLDMLERGVPPEELKQELLAHDAAQPFRDYVEAFEPRCLEVATRIVDKWAVRG